MFLSCAGYRLVNQNLFAQFPEMPRLKNSGVIARKHLTSGSKRSTLAAHCNPFIIETGDREDAMAVRKMKVLKALALFLVFCFAQVYVQAGLGNPGGGIPQGARLITARLTTRGGAALVNGVSTA